MKTLAKIVITALSLIVVATLFPGIIVDSVWSALMASLLLGVLNITLKPILFILTLPITFITLGLFSFILNGLFFWFASLFISGFQVDGIMSAILGAIAVSVLSWLGGKMFLS
jgi:putative membrane protein